jgi:nitroreductase
MELMEIIKKRVSVRSYHDKAIPKDIIDSILEAARFAPSARDAQPLEYKVITNKALIKRLSETIGEVLKKEAPPLKAPPAGFRPNFFYDAPLLIIIAGPKENHWIASDAALAVQNILLYATSVNLGCCFIGMARMLEKDPKAMRELHLGDDKSIAAAVICGYPAEKPAPKEKRMKAEFFV